MSAALRRWDKSVAQESPPSSANVETLEGQEEWHNQCNRIDKWVQEVLIELQVRQKKACSERHVNLSVEGRSKCKEKENLARDGIQFSDRHSENRSGLPTHGSDSDEDRETNSSFSSNSEEEWESAPEV